MDIDQGQSQMLGEGVIPLNVHSSVGIDGLQAAGKDRSTCPRSPSTPFPIRTADIGQRTRVFPTVTNALASDHGGCTLDVYPRVISATRELQGYSFVYSRYKIYPFSPSPGLLGYRRQR